MTAQATTPTTAAAVSAVLHRAGLKPLPSGTPRTREGLRVSGSGSHVYVAADLDNDRDARHLADDAHAAMTAAGYAVAERLNGYSFYVTGRTA